LSGQLFRKKINPVHKKRVPDLLVAYVSKSRANSLFRKRGPTDCFHDGIKQFLDCIFDFLKKLRKEISKDIAKNAGFATVAFAVGFNSGALAIRALAFFAAAQNIRAGNYAHGNNQHRSDEQGR